MKKRYLLLLLAAAVVAVAVYLRMARTVPLLLDTVAVAEGPVAETVTNTRAGTVEACRRARLAPQAGGQIARLPVHKGDHVKKGQVLLELWSEDLRAELTLAERDAASTRAHRDEICVSARVARTESERLAKLADRKLVSVELVERAAGQAESGAASCRAAGEQIRVAEARVDATRARLERMLLRAPFDGTVAEINGELGEFVTPSPVGIPTPPAVDVVDNTCIYITAPIDEVDAPRVREGMKARVTLDAFKNRRFPAHVRRVAPYVLEVEKQARTVEIEAEIEGSAAAGLLPGYSADVEVVLAEQPRVLRVPTRALIEGKRVYVFDAAKRRVHLRDVETGIGNWEYTEVRRGLAAGERIVLSVDRAGLADGVAAASR